MLVLNCVASGQGALQGLVEVAFEATSPNCRATHWQEIRLAGNEEWLHSTLHDSPTLGMALLSGSEHGRDSAGNRFAAPLEAVGAAAWLWGWLNRFPLNDLYADGKSVYSFQLYSNSLEAPLGIPNIIAAVLPTWIVVPTDQAAEDRSTATRLR